jgi:hypothetical protein
MRKFEAIIDSAILRDLVRDLQKGGIHSYSIIEGLMGRGERGVRRPESIHGESSNAMLIAVVPADRVSTLSAIVAPYIKHHGGIAWTTPVEIA